MPVRSITVKLVIPRKSEALSAARDLWATHAAVNNAVAYYEVRFLEMRGLGYVLGSGTTVSEEDTVARLDAMIAEARQRNGRAGTLTTDQTAEIRRMLRQLYEAIVPSSIGEKGEAQQANAYLGPLTDTASKGFLSVFEKVEAPPAWVNDVRAERPEALIAAAQWAISSEGKARLQATGSPPAWVRKFRKGDADWPITFVADYDKKHDEAQGVPTIIRTLKNAGVLPFFPPCLTTQITDARGTLSPWDRLAFRLAVAHLLSWETWGRKTAEDHLKRSAQVEEFQADYLDRPDLAPAITALHHYEQERANELAITSLAPVAPFRVRVRMVRHWPELRERWLKSKNQSRYALMVICAAEQTRHRGGFGDPHLFAWLAEPVNHHVWQQATDVVTLLVRYNALLALFERSRDHAAMTLPDASIHPRSVQWEPEGGSNLKNYKLVAAEGKLRTVLPLLRTAGNGQFIEVAHTFAVAPSSQFQRVLLERGGKSVSLTYENQSGEVFAGKLNSADLLLDGGFTRYRPADQLAAGHIEPAFLKLVVDLNPILPPGWDGKTPKAVNHFKSAIGKETWASEVRPGLRVLSVDMGMRSFAACSVFTLLESQPATGKLAYPVKAAGNTFWAVHERSFVLRLPDEEIDNQGLAWRQSASEELRALRRGLNRYRMLYRLQTDETLDQRQQSLADLQEVLGDTGWPFEADLLDPLNRGVILAEEEWIAQVEQAIRQYRREFGIIVKDWRRRTRLRSRDKGLGKSMWAIDYLTNVRRFLVSWSLAGEHSGDIRRLDRTRRGIFASRLLDHIDDMKKDRLKTGADLIVQAARGSIRDAAGQWRQRYAPCQTVLFEDLTRYRMKTDRPRRENSQLMLWAHRQIPEVVEMQGQIYGITICDTGAAFSSRYHAVTNTPGIRCHPITTADKSNEFFRQLVQREHPCLDWETLKPGDLLPLGGGELFACMTATGKVTIHADINAAQNLQRRFWTRHADPFRLPSRRVKVNGEERWLPHKLGKRLLGGLGGYGILVPTGHESGSCRWETLTARQWRSFGGELREEVIDADALGVEGIGEDILEESSEVTVFFRDPSGIVLPSGLWYPAKTFWSIVKTKTEKALLNH